VNASFRNLLCATLLLVAGLPAWAAERSDAGGRPVWRVKVVTPRGEVRVVLVDVATGQTF
jgi:hypothetical protein